MAAKTGMTAQNRLILWGLITSTILIVVIAVMAMFNIQQKLNEGYKNFAQIISKTLAIESMEVTKDVPQPAIYDILRTHTQSVLRSNDDIAFIEFRDSNSKVIYSSKEDYPQQAERANIAVSSPMVDKNLGQSNIVGSVMVGLSGNIISKISTATRLSLIIVFVIAWLIVASVVLINTLLITRELRNLYYGVRKISTGEFGYKIEGKDVSREVKELYDAFNDMSTRLHQYEEQNIDEITLEKNKLESILMSIVNGVVVCNHSDNVVLINEHAKTLLDVSGDEILNTKIQQYCDTNGELCFKEKIEQFKDTPLEEIENKPLEFSIEVSQRIIKSVISPMFSRSGEYVGYIIILIDVTKEAEMDKLRAHFISNVSHELRTPVTVLRSYIDTLYNYGNDFDYNTQKEFIGVMNQEIIRLNRMVNDILDFSRYESQNVRLEKDRCNIVELIEDTINQLKVLAEEHNLTFSVIIEPELPQVMLNRESISRVLMNIVSNAIKYSPNDTRIKIRAERARNTNFVEVSVEDQGPGIAEEHQHKIFDRFFRVENATHTIKGTGLGLHLVKISVEKHHGGEVFVKSKLGEGSTFGFRLPIDAPVVEDEEYKPQHVPPVDEQVQPQEDTNGWEISLEQR